jgi:hypothetical protein
MPRWYHYACRACVLRQERTDVRVCSVFRPTLHNSGGRRRTICKAVKQFPAAISFAVTRVGLGVGDNRVVFWYASMVVCLKIRFQKHFVCCVQIYKKSVLEIQLYFLNLKTTFYSRDKGNPWTGRKRSAGHMLLSPDLDCMRVCLRKGIPMYYEYKMHKIKIVLKNETVSDSEI